MRVVVKILAIFLVLGALLYGLDRVGMLPQMGSKDDSSSGRFALVELSVQGADNDLLAIILSGDGGWADLDHDFGHAFQQRGVATIGFDCLKYFWKARHPAEVASDLESAIRHYLGAWSKRRLLLVGYSFGAGWLPFLVNRLPQGLQDKVALVALLAPGDYATVEIKAGDWLTDSVRPGALQVLPEARRLRPPVLCVYGTDQAKESICPGLNPPNVRVLAMPGGHHFNHDYAPIQEAILRAAK